MKEKVADDEPENGVAEEFEGLVVTNGVVPGLVRIRLMGQRPRQKLAPAELMAESFLEFG